MSLSSSSFYDIVAPYYDDYCRQSGVEETIEGDTSLLESYNPTSVLEIGIGTGRFAQEYLNRNPYVEYIGVDNSKEMLARIPDIPVTLVHSDINEYLTLSKTRGRRFDAIIAPYAALHHIEKESQNLLFEKMKGVADIIILNSLTEDEERRLFGKNDSTDITFNLLDGKSASTTVHKISNNIRASTKSKPSGPFHENLLLSLGN